MIWHYSGLQTKYDALAEQLGMRFFAVAIDTYGALHEEANNFIGHMAKQISESLRSEFCKMIKVAIQHALLKGNASTIHKAVSRLRSRTGVWF